MSAGEIFMSEIILPDEEQQDPTSIRLNIPRQIIHLEVGTEDWVPTKEELKEIQNMWLAAEKDPKGGVFTTRVGVRVNVVYID
jgi:hypothetical protein